MMPPVNTHDALVRKYLFEYQYEGTYYCFTLPAQSPEEAEARLTHLVHARYLGQVEAEITAPTLAAAPVGAGVRLITWWKNVTRGLRKDHIMTLFVLLTALFLCPLTAHAITFHLSAIVTQNPYEPDAHLPTGLHVGDPLQWLVTYDDALLSIPGEVNFREEGLPMPEVIHLFGPLVAPTVIYPELLIRDGVPVFLSTQIEHDSLPYGALPFATQWNFDRDFAQVDYADPSLGLGGHGLEVHHTPEPQSWLLLATGVLLLTGLKYRARCDIDHT